MRDCPTIRFGDLDNIAKPGKQGKSTLNVPVWSRTELTQAYGIEDELNFIYWALLVGNDYTEHFSHSQLGFPAGDRFPSKDRLLEAFIDGEVSWDPMAAIVLEECRQAVVYSIRVYQLEDVTPLLIEKYKTVNQLEDLSDLEEGLRLSRVVKNTLYNWFAANKNQQQNLASWTLSFLESTLQNSKSLLGDVVTVHHIAAFKEMLTAIASKRTDTKFLGTKLHYVDQKAANIYQLLIREVDKLMKGGNELAGKPFKVSGNSSCSTPSLSYLFLFSLPISMMVSPFILL